MTAPDQTDRPSRLRELLRNARRDAVEPAAARYRAAVEAYRDALAELERTANAAATACEALGKAMEAAQQPLPEDHPLLFKWQGRMTEDEYVGSLERARQYMGAEAFADARVLSPAEYEELVATARAQQQQRERKDAFHDSASTDWTPDTTDA